MATVMASGSGRASVVDQMLVNDKPEVQNGGSLMQRNPHFPETRTCRDVIWAGLFIILAAAVAVGAVYSAIQVFIPGIKAGLDFSEENESQKVFLKQHVNTFLYGMMSIVATAVVASFLSLAFLFFAKKGTECVVWTCVILGPLMTIACGAYIMSQSWPFPGIFGALLAFLGCCMLACFIFAWKDLVPMTVLLLRTVIHVVELHPAMMLLSICSALLSAAWNLACAACVLGAVIADEDMAMVAKSKVSSSPSKAGLLFLYALVYFWGSLVLWNTAHTANAGVYGRWYFQKDAASPVADSLRVAWTTSFGSICYGSFIVAVIRAFETLVRALKRAAQEEGEIVLCIVLACVECCINCIGDILQGVSEWAYIQCAVRGLGFCESILATFALTYQAGLDAFMSTLLIDTVPFLGALLVGAASGCVGFLVFTMHTVIESYNTAIFLGCFLIGFNSAYSALMPLKTGSCTIISCFGEDSDFLRRKAPSLYEALVQVQIEDSRDSSAASSRRGSHQLHQGQGARDMRAAPLVEMQGQNQR